MNEKPILMSGPMVKAILEGRKTQTRRVIKPQLPEYGYESVVPDLPVFFWKGHRFIAPYQLVAHCPYGQPGDSLWVRETWTALFENDNGMILWWHDTPKEQRTKDRLIDSITYRADYKPEPDDEWPFVPSIFMPRWASRLTLQVTGVRVERVQDISVDDIQAEGVYPGLQAACENWKAASIKNDNYQYIQDFKWLWDSINGKRPGCSWDDNPWVWVVEFRKIDP